jgi:hypothetical protein
MRLAEVGGVAPACELSAVDGAGQVVMKLGHLMGSAVGPFAGWGAVATATGAATLPVVDDVERNLVDAHAIQQVVLDGVSTPAAHWTYRLVLNATLSGVDGNQVLKSETAVVAASHRYGVKIDDHAARLELM